MPRGQSKPSPILSNDLRVKFEPARMFDRVHSLGRTAEEPRPAIERSVRSFIEAWFNGDTGAMVRCLHPDYVHRLVAIDGRGEPPRELLRGNLGVQGQLGSLTAPERRRQEVRILDIRAHCASVVADLGEWVLQIHLARSGGQWNIVNAMWEMSG